MIWKLYHQQIIYMILLAVNYTFFTFDKNKHQPRGVLKNSCTAISVKNLEK